MSEATNGVLTAQDDRGVVTLVLDRPEKGNAYTRDMLVRLAAEIARASEDASIRALVLRGAGKHFGVGGDLDDTAVHLGDDAGAVIMPRVCLALDACPKPTVAFVHGACFGGIFALAACCDVMIAREDASFAVPELILGFPVGPYVPFFEKALGPRALRRFLITGERFGAAEALALGVAHRVVASHESEDVLASVIDKVLLAAPTATAAAKRDLRGLAGVAPTGALLDGLQRSFARDFVSPEGREGRAAFREKRPPAWAPRTRA